MDSFVEHFFREDHLTLADPMEMINEGLVLGAESVRIKSKDRTVVTKQDESIELKMRLYLTSKYPHIIFWGEESEEQRIDGRWVFLCDPLDNTRKFADGEPGSAVFVGLYDAEKREVAACHVGDPSTGRVWSAMVGVLPRLSRWGSDVPKQVRVTSAPLSYDSSSFRIDVSHGFNVFSDDQISQLQREMVRLGKSVFIGSNILNQALVANGGPHGAIATAKGGPWDFAAGCRLVPDAGGVVIAYKAVGRVVGEKRLERLDRLDPVEADVLVMGNCQETADSLARLVEAI